VNNDPNPSLGLTCVDLAEACRVLDNHRMSKMVKITNILLRGPRLTYHDPRFLSVAMTSFDRRSRMPTPAYRCQGCCGRMDTRPYVRYCYWIFCVAILKKVWREENKKLPDVVLKTQLGKGGVYVGSSTNSKGGVTYRISGRYWAGICRRAFWRLLLERLDMIL
jgi:hypothetical protein